MPARVHLASLLLALAAAACAARSATVPPPPATIAATEQPAAAAPGGPLVAELVVRPTRIVDWPTRRASTSFEFSIVRVHSDPDQVLARSVANGMLQFRSYQGADVQGGKDAAERLRALIGSGRVEPPTSESGRLGAVHVFDADAGELRLLVLRPTGSHQELWLLIDANGRRITLAPRKNN